MHLYVRMAMNCTGVRIFSFVWDYFHTFANIIIHYPSRSRLSLREYRVLLELMDINFSHFSCLNAISSLVDLMNFFNSFGYVMYRYITSASDTIMVDTTGWCTRLIIPTNIRPREDEPQLELFNNHQHCKQV